MDSKKLYPLAALGYEFFIRVSNFSKNQKLSFKNLILLLKKVEVLYKIE